MFKFSPDTQVYKRDFNINLAKNFVSRRVKKLSVSELPILATRFAVGRASLFGKKRVLAKADKSSIEPQK